MSEAKVEKIKVTIYALRGIRPYCSSHSGSRTENCGNRFVSNVIQGLIHVQGSSFATGVEVQDRRKRVLVISTGSKSVDAILGGKQHVSPPSPPKKLRTLSTRRNHVSVNNGRYVSPMDSSLTLTRFYSGKYMASFARERHRWRTQCAW